MGTFFLNFQETFLLGRWKILEPKKGKSQRQPGKRIESKEFGGQIPARFYRRAASHPAGALDKVKTRGNAENGGGINGRKAGDPFGLT